MLYRRPLAPPAGGWAGVVWPLKSLLSWLHQVAFLEKWGSQAKNVGS